MSKIEVKYKMSCTIKDKSCLCNKEFIRTAHAETNEWQLTNTPQLDEYSIDPYSNNEYDTFQWNKTKISLSKIIYLKIDDRIFVKDGKVVI